MHVETFGQLLGNAGIAEMLHPRLLGIVFWNALDDILSVFLRDGIGLDGRGIIGQTAQYVGIELPIHWQTLKRLETGNRFRQVVA